MYRNNVPTRSTRNFDLDDRYFVPLTTYLTYRLQLAKLQKNRSKRRRGIWWVFVQIVILRLYTEITTKEFEKLQKESYGAIIPMLHNEYVMKLNRIRQ